MPPPNVTGILHMGHALNNAIQDTYIRYHRMLGHEALWLPGTDHAGIATQTKVEKKLREEGKTRYDLGREKFVEEVWKWKHEHSDFIEKQLRALGCGPDWRRFTFTMDEKYEKAVLEAFVRLYNKGLIYRGKRIINWSPLAQSALSDEEVIHKETKGKLHFFRYPLIDRKAGEPEFIIIATTRPETMLGDVAVAVNPTDERYKNLVGRKLRLPLMDREIPIIADDYVDKEFGTGCVKITPAHDPNDFEIGLRHNLPQINVMDTKAHINEHGGKYAGLDRYVARKKILADLEELGLIEKIEDYTNSVGYSERGGEMIEPYLSDQWFVKDEAACRTCSASCRRRAHPFSSRAMDQYLSPLDDKYPRLVHLASALVGTAHSCMVLRRRRLLYARMQRAGRLPRKAGEMSVLRLAL